METILESNLEDYYIVNLYYLLTTSHARLTNKKYFGQIFYYIIDTNLSNINYQSI